MRRAAVGLAWSAGVLLCSQWAFAPIMFENARLDYALYPRHDPKLVVAGTITGLEWEKMPETHIFVPPRYAVLFDVESVILGDPRHHGRTIRVNCNSFMWPTELVRCEVGQRCMLIVDPRWKTPATKPSSERAETQGAEGKQIEDCGRIAGVLPVRHRDLETAKTTEAARRVVVNEILAVLKEETDPARQRLLILQVGPVLTFDEGMTLAPFLNSGRPWLRRAALAGMVYATGKPEYVRLAAEDVQEFLSSHKASDTVDDVDVGRGYAAHQLLFRYYFFLNPLARQWGTRWDEPTAQEYDCLFEEMVATGVLSDDVIHILTPAPRVVQTSTAPG